MIRLHAREYAADRWSADGIVEYNGSHLVATVDEIPITDTRMGPVWGGILYRVVLTGKSFPASGQLVYRMKGS
jgi:hypothetical protein